MQAYTITSHLTKILLMGSSFLSKSVLFLHEVQIGKKELVLVTATLLLHGEEDDRAANSYFHTMLGRVWSSEVDF